MSARARSRVTRRLALLLTTAIVAVGATATAAQAVPPIVTTGDSFSAGQDSSTLSATVDSHGCETQIFYSIGPTPDLGPQLLSNSFGNELGAFGPQPTSQQIIGLTAYTFYYYRVSATTTNCPPGGVVGESGQGAVRCMTKQPITDTPESAPCPGEQTTPPGGTTTPPGGTTTPPGGTTTPPGGTTTPPGGDTTQPGTSDGSTGDIKTISPKGRRCLVPNKIGYVLRLTAQGIKCRAIWPILNGQKARNQIGSLPKVTLGKFKCTALNRLIDESTYHCTHGSRGWYMNVFAAGAWTVRNPVMVNI